MLQGRALHFIMYRAPFDNIQKAEFKVFCSFMRINLQYLIRESGIEVHEQIFVEFGVENYSEKHTFSLQSDHWRGLIIDNRGLYKNCKKR